MITKLKWYEKALIYGIIGLAAEIIFTSVAEPSPSMVGHSYLWMILVWPVGFFTLEHVGHYVKSFHIITRLIIYALLCFVVEYSFGMFFKIILGVIPWDYSEAAWNISGAIRLDYFPVWCTAGFLSEIIVKYVNSLGKDHG